jgi:hypothetical protein
MIWPSPTPPHPDNTPPPTIPDPNPSPEPPMVYPPQWVLVYIPGYGWHYVVIQPAQPK